MWRATGTGEVRDSVQMFNYATVRECLIVGREILRRRAVTSASGFNYAVQSCYVMLLDAELLRWSLRVFLRDAVGWTDHGVYLMRSQAQLVVVNDYYDL